MGTESSKAEIQKHHPGRSDRRASSIRPNRTIVGLAAGSVNGENAIFLAIRFKGNYGIISILHCRVWFNPFSPGTPKRVPYPIYKSLGGGAVMSKLIILTVFVSFG